VIAPEARARLDAETDFFRLRENLLSNLLAVLRPYRADDVALADARELIAIYDAHPAHVEVRDRMFSELETVRGAS
jgi:hypothetical protein